MTITIGASRTGNQRAIQRIDQLFRPERYREALAEAMNKSAGRARKRVVEQIPDYIDRPTRFTQNRNAVRFQRTRSNVRINQMRVIVHLAPIQNRYLRPLVLGETLTELYNREPVIKPVVRNLASSGFGLGARLNRSGNVPGIRSGKIDRIIDDPRTFVINIGADSHLDPGIWLRRGENDVIMLFAFERRLEYEAQLPFHRLAAEAYRATFAECFREALR